MKISILIAYYNRPRQLARSLWLLQRQTHPHEDMEIILVDDGSTEPPKYDVFASPTTVWYHPMRPAGSPPRSPNTALRHAYTHCSGDFIIIGGPEIMAPLHAIETMLTKGDMSRRNVPTLYYLAWNHHLSTVDWKENLDNLQQLPDFMATRGEHGYSNFDSPNMFNHAGFSGATREVWDKINFLPDTENWGRTDSYWHEREMELDLIPHKLHELSVYHQWHDIIHGDIPQYSQKVKQIRKSQMEG